MGMLRFETIIESDGELHLANLPCHKGEKVEVVLTYPDAERERLREDARRRLLEVARKSNFQSEGPYPSRAELWRL